MGCKNWVSHSRSWGTGVPHGGYGRGPGPRTAFCCADDVVRHISVILGKHHNRVLEEARVRDVQLVRNANLFAHIAIAEDSGNKSSSFQGLYL